MFSLYKITSMFTLYLITPVAVLRGGKRGDVPPLAFKEGEGGGRGVVRFWARRAQNSEKNGYQLVFCHFSKFKRLLKALSK